MLNSLESVDISSQPIQRLHVKATEWKLKESGSTGYSKSRNTEIRNGNVK